jgi:hypothetical protein
MVGVGQDARAAKPARRGDDSLAIGRNQNAFRERGLAGPFVRVLDQILTGVLGENLTGESGGGVPSRNTYYDSHRRLNPNIGKVIWPDKLHTVMERGDSVVATRPN